MSNLTQARDELAEIYQKYECNHEDTAIRAQTIASGGIHYVYQCQRCGQRTSYAIAKSKAISLNNGQHPPPFDNLLKEEWQNARQSEIDEYNNRSKAKKSSWWQAYNDYLNSPEWAHNRKKVIRRANGVCEGCLENPATEVHHLSYQHVGYEFMFELIALCNTCHERIHASSEDTEVQS